MRPLTTELVSTFQRHAFVHLIDFGGTVTVRGLTIGSGDILYGDRHGLMTVPADIVPDIPDVVARMSDEKRQVIAFCRSRNSRSSHSIPW